MVVLHPNIADGYALAIFGFVGIGDGDERVAEYGCAFFENLITRIYGVKHVGIFERSAHLHVHGTAIEIEFRGRLVGPYLRVDHRSAVVHAEKHELLVNGIVLADSHQPMFARCQGRNIECDGCVGLHRLGGQLIIYIVAYIAWNFCSRCVSETESDAFEAVLLTSLRQITTQHREFAT